MLRVVLVAMLCVGHACSFATHMTREYCERELRVGVVIMGKEIVLSEERQLLVFRFVDGEQQLVRSGSTVSSGEILYFKLEPKSFQFVLETSEGAHFEDGKCANKRRTHNQNASLVIDSQHTEISVIAAYAKSYNMGVQVTQPFFLSRDDANKEL